ncbi:hypothetical protein SISNIDRAFT_352754 [Sistotremastrum niveocremeum HHB9708]|uniref:Uncharacterized protein n=1 Tax=Sistotremastrum niveocremeum HHB9708 TaxID=1314777 RepID=A0A164X492_9AGAM|nr:hypothetical protein SISNIDRAFT_352754 [Sistotremastrum niveocremeum HHB9708]
MPGPSVTVWACCNSAPAGRQPSSVTCRPRCEFFWLFVTRDEELQIAVFATPPHLHASFAPSLPLKNQINSYSSI